MFIIIILRDYIYALNLSLIHIFLNRLCRGIAWLCRGETWRVSGRVGRQAVSRIAWTGLLCMALCIAVILFLYAFFGYRLMIFTTALLLGVVCVAGTLYLLVMQARDGQELDALTEQVEAAASGQETRPALPEESPLHKTSLQIARLDEGVKQSLASALKSERMKVELITCLLYTSQHHDHAGPAQKTGGRRHRRG